MICWHREAWRGNFYTKFISLTYIWQVVKLIIRLFKLRLGWARVINKIQNTEYKNKREHNFSSSNCKLLVKKENILAAARKKYRVFASSFIKLLKTIDSVFSWLEERARKKISYKANGTLPNRTTPLAFDTFSKYPRINGERSEGLNFPEISWSVLMIKRRRYV